MTTTAIFNARSTPGLKSALAGAEGSPTSPVGRRIGYHRRPSVLSQPCKVSILSITTIEITDEDGGRRLDVALTARLDGLSRARIQALIKDGRVTAVGGRTIGDGGLRVKPGDVYRIEVPAPVPADAGRAIDRPRGGVTRTAS